MRMSAGYLLVQGLAGAVWWGVLLWHPPWRAYFKPPESPDWAILGFWLADLSLFVCGTLIAAILLARRSAWASAALWFTSGAVSYAALYCFGLSLLTNTTWAAAAAMLPAMSITIAIAVHHQRSCLP